MGNMKRKEEKQKELSLISDLDVLLTIPVTDNDGTDKEQLELQIFEQLIGPYQEVLDSAAKLIKLVVSEEIYYYDTGYDRSDSCWCDPMPMCRYQYLDGPLPDIHVYVGLFLGAEKEQESREKAKQDDENGGIDNFIEIQNSIGSRWNTTRA